MRPQSRVEQGGLPGREVDAGAEAVWRAVSDRQSLTARPSEGAQESRAGWPWGKLPKTAERVPRPRDSRESRERGTSGSAGRPQTGRGFTQGRGRAGSEGRHAQL